MNKSIEKTHQKIQHKVAGDPLYWKCGTMCFRGEFEPRGHRFEHTEVPRMITFEFGSDKIL